METYRLYKVNVRTGKNGRLFFRYAVVGVSRGDVEGKVMNHVREKHGFFTKANPEFDVRSENNHEEVYF